MRRALIRIALVLLGLALLGVAAGRWLNERGEDSIDNSAPSTAATPELIARGAYLARAGNCMGCHTAHGGAAYAGGRGVPTPFGTNVAPNLTPDRSTGIGDWSQAEFCARCTTAARATGACCTQPSRTRNALGATRSTLDLAGGLIPVQNWYAASLTSPDGAGVAAWDVQHMVERMRSGISARGAVMGPMREVVAARSRSACR